MPSAVAMRLMQRVRRAGDLSRARALALAAIRETFEETRLLLGVRHTDPPASPPSKFVARLLPPRTMPSLEPLHLIARAIAPPRRPKRFDTRQFFALDAARIVARLDGCVGPQSELSNWPGSVWTRPGQRLDLPVITSVVLSELKQRLQAGMGHELPVPFYHERNRRWLREEL